MAVIIGCVLGIDPGKEGGFALISPEAIVKTFPMPETEEGIRDLFYERIKPVGVMHCQIEKVHAMPKNGAVSMFKFGRNAGVLIGMLLAHRISFRETDPKVWQNGLGIPRRIRIPKKSRQVQINFARPESDRDWKKRLMALAKKLYPEADVTLETADALLIAEFARRDFFGILGRPLL
jgi:hypothetical protein